jgi:hypothetical protein
VVKKRSYGLNPKYKEKVCKELDQMLQVGSIVPVEESVMISLIVLQPKKMGDLRICVDLCNLNVECIHDPFLTPFIEKVLENVCGVFFML